METWVITGGAGFIGTSFIEYVHGKSLAHGVLPKIFIFDNFSAFSFSDYEKFNHKKIDYKVVENTNAALGHGEIGIIFGDITDQKGLEIAIPSADWYCT